MNRMLLAWGLGCLVAVAGCKDQKRTPKKVAPAQKAKPEEEKSTGPATATAQPAAKAQRPSVVPSYAGALELTPWDTVEQVEAACAKHVGAAKALQQRILAQGAPRTVANTLKPMNQLLMQLDRVMPMSELIANVHPKKAVRAAAEKCEQQAKEYLSRLKLDRKIYESLEAMKLDGMDKGTRRFVRLLLRDYRRSGVDRDKPTRNKLAALHQKIVKLGQTFTRNIREDKRFIEVSERDLDGLPRDYIEARKKRAKGGKIKITTDYPDFYPFETYAKNEALRKKLYAVYLKRAFPKNQRVLTELLASRHSYAKTLGYSDWAAYNAEDKMVKKKEVIASFLQKVVTLAKPAMEADLREILARKKKDDPKATSVGAWDRFYYVNKIRKERFGVDPQLVRAHFPFVQVKAGIIALAQSLFAVRFKKIDAKVWHPSVEAYDVYDRDQRVARFYLDLHPRKGKYGHAAEFPILTGVPGKQLPAAALVTNFPDPSKGPALTEHSQVTTFFHEFGHLMHQLLSGRHQWVTQSGISCEWDFVEAPSQLLEEWTWDHQVLARFGRHYQTKKTISKELVDKMRKAKEFGKGVHVMRQMFYAHLSFLLHQTDPTTFDLTKKVQQIYAQVSPYPYQPKTAVFASFGHLNGYSSMYYTYMWSLVLAKDLFTRFKSAGLMDANTALAYRKAVLEVGGAEDADKMVAAFLGRPHSFDAFQRWLRR